MFFLFNMIFAIVAMIIDRVTGLTFGEMPYGVFYLIYALAVLVPGLALWVRRLHDISKSGWMVLIAFIPIVGAIWLLVLAIQDSTPGENQYGPNPKGL